MQAVTLCSTPERCIGYFQLHNVVSWAQNACVISFDMRAAKYFNPGIKSCFERYFVRSTVSNGRHANDTSTQSVQYYPVRCLNYCNGPHKSCAKNRLDTYSATFGALTQQSSWLLKAEGLIKERYRVSVDSVKCAIRCRASAHRIPVARKS